VLPGIRAHIATGLRVALGTAWIVIVPAEMLGVDSGLGYAILDARDRLRYDELVGIVLLIGTVGAALDGVARRLATRSRGRGRPRRATAVVPEPLPADAGRAGAGVAS
jgi:NitT/TauT family transport system permease protein